MLALFCPRSVPAPPEGHWSLFPTLAQLHRIWWKQLTVYGSTMDSRTDFEAVYELPPAIYLVS